MAITRVEDIEPPDDTGSDTFSRFIYQAHVTFPLCLYAATGTDISNIYAEHIEDVAVEQSDRWRFLQIKTRNPGSGPWTLSDLITKGGAIHSLWRAYEAAGAARACTYEMHLEGHPKTGDAIHHLRNEAGRANDIIITRIRNAVKAGEAAVRDFCARLDVRFPPVRGSIVSSNLRLLGDQAPSLTFMELRTTYASVIAAVEEAMMAGRLDEQWPSEILDGERSPHATLLAAKRISRSRAAELLDRVASSPRPLLKRLIATSSEPTVLEQKLIAGGAPDALIADAKQLRAHASIRRLEYLASTSSDEAHLEDVRERLRIAANGLVAEYSPGRKVAAVVWNRLRTELTASAAAVDNQRIFSQDPHLLLGEVCELADECLTDWGRDDA